MNRDASSTPATNLWITRGAALSLLIAGVIHLAILPHHWAHTPAHGIFMGIIGVAEITWGVAFWLKPSSRLAMVGVVIAIGCITLWGITRLLPAPYGHGPEEVDASGIITKTLESITTLSLIGTIYTLTSPKIGRRVGRTVLVVIVLAIFSGFGLYGAARASEPLFPQLMASEIQEHEEAEKGQEHEEPHSPATETPYYDYEY
jgi:hypothetical protein